MSDKKVSIIINKTRKKMYTTNYSVGVNPNPEAYITKGKNRIKQHTDVVYLNDGDQFEIELFNPKIISVLAKIKINGNYISNRGLVVKPGQRIHLDRYIDEAKKFLFNTYEVNGDNQQVMEAIQNNGLVEIEFYDETVLSGINFGNSGTSNFPWNQPNYIPNHFYYYNTSFPINPYTVTCDNSLGAVGANGVSGVDGQPKLKSTYNKIETGRVEKGEASNTKLKNVNMDFSSFSSHSITWKILPNSQKPVEVAELRNYCTGCGARIKKTNWKFCPTCGNEL
jgi:Zn finger protein HypA/HybF involved in hydrogenase expression